MSDGTKLRASKWLPKDFHNSGDHQFYTQECCAYDRRATMAERDKISVRSTKFQSTKFQTEFISEHKISD